MPSPRLAPSVTPVLETSRLRLRGHRIEDLDACAAMWGDPAVTRFIGGRPSPRDEVWARLLRYVGHWDLMGFGFWAVEEKASGVFLGDIGFADFKRAIEPSLDGVPEMGWGLAPHAQGRGYATEAVAAALNWGDRHFGPTPTACIIDPENRASIGVALKNGYREFARTTYRDSPTIIYRREATG